MTSPPCRYALALKALRSTSATEADVAEREAIRARIRNSPMEVTAREKRAAGGKDALLRQRLDAIGAGMPEGLFGRVQHQPKDAA